MVGFGDRSHDSLKRTACQRIALPAACPYKLDQILDPDWYPENVHGIEDPAP